MSAFTRGFSLGSGRPQSHGRLHRKKNIYLNENVTGKIFGIRRCPEQAKASVVFEFNWTARIQIVIWILAFQFPQGSSARTLIRTQVPACIPAGATTDLRMFCCALSLEVALTTCGRFGCWHSPGKPPV